MTDFSAPTVDRIRRRLHYRLDGSPGARCRAVGPEGRPTHYTAPRAAVAAVALRWCALGYRDVQIALAPRREVGPARFRPYPATQDEAIQAVRELAARRAVGAGQWRRFLRRLDTQSVIVPSDPNPPNEGDQPPMDHLTEFCRAYLRDARDEGAVEQDASDAVIDREARKLEGEIYQLASSFVANTFDDSEVTP